MKLVHVYGRPTPAALAAYARRLDIFKFFVSVCSIFPNIPSLSSETVQKVFIYLDPILIYISLRIDCLFEIRKIAVCFLWLSLPDDYRVTD